MSSLSSSLSSPSDIYSSASSRKMNNETKRKFHIDEQIQELEDEDSSNYASYDNRKPSSESSSGDEELSKRLKLNRMRFQQELREIKESVLSSDNKESSSKRKLPSSLYESARSGTLDLSESLAKHPHQDDLIESRIKRLEQELQDTIKSKQSQSQSQSNESIVSRKLHFDTASKYERLDEETRNINEQIERVKRQLEKENRQEEERRIKLKRNMKKKQIEESQRENIHEKSEIKLIEQTLLAEIDKLKQDNEQLRQMFTNQPTPLPPPTVGRESSRLQQLIQEKSITKLEVEVQLLQQVDRIRTRLQRSIQRKLSNEKDKAYLVPSKDTTAKPNFKKKRQEPQQNRKGVTIK